MFTLNPSISASMIADPLAANSTRNDLKEADTSIVTTSSRTATAAPAASSDATSVSSRAMACLLAVVVSDRGRLLPMESSNACSAATLSMRCSGAPLPLPPPSSPSDASANSASSIISLIPAAITLVCWISATSASCGAHRSSVPQLTRSFINVLLKSRSRIGDVSAHRIASTCTNAAGAAIICATMASTPKAVASAPPAAAAYATSIFLASTAKVVAKYTGVS